MEIYAKGENIPTYAFANLFTQGENFADIIRFVVDRYYCGKDLSMCTFTIRGLTSGNWEVSQNLLMELVTEDKITLRWKVADTFTHNAGNLKLELRASETVSETDYTIIKYSMADVNVAETPAGQNGPLPETSEQAVSEINEAVGNGIAELTSETAADMALLQQKMDDFDLEEVEARLDQMEEDTQTYLARPEVIPVTRAEYESIIHKQNSLYVIIGDE